VESDQEAKAAEPEKEAYAAPSKSVEEVADMLVESDQEAKAAEPEKEAHANPNTSAETK
jgi:hypothetical protein